MILQYSQTNLTDDELQNKLQAQESQRVRMIYVDCNRLTLRSVEIMGFYNWENLEHILINDNPIGNQGWKQLVKINMPKLKTINLGNTLATDDGWNYLARADWKQLHDIWVGGNQLRKNPKLIKTNFPRMKWVSFNTTNDTTAKFNLQESRRILQIDWKAIECIFFPKQHLNDRQQRQFLEQAKKCFNSNARLQYS